MVRDWAPCDQDYAPQESTVGWFMYIDNRALYGNGKWSDDEAGEIKPDQVLTVQVDTDAGTLKFWVDGKPHGPGYSGVTESLRWTSTVEHEGDFVEIVLTPELR